MKKIIFALLCSSRILGACEKSEVVPLDTLTVTRVGKTTIDFEKKASEHLSYRVDLNVDSIYISSKFNPVVSLINPCGCPNDYADKNNLQPVGLYRYVYVSYHTGSKSYQVLISNEAKTITYTVK